MCKTKKAAILVVVVVCAIISSAPAATWKGPGVDWCTASNWNPAGVPSDSAVIDNTSPDRGPIIGIGCNASVDITGPNPAEGHTQVMDINTSGTVTVTGDEWEWRDSGVSGGTAIININGSPTISIGGSWRATDFGTSIINISGNPKITVAGDIRGADENSGLFFINMSGGLLHIDGEMLWGDNGGGGFNLHGGTVFINEDLNFGGLRGTAPIDVNVYGGHLMVREATRLPGGATRAGVTRLNVYGGIVDCNQLVHGGTDGLPYYSDDWRIDITQGILKLRGNVKAVIDANIAAHQITGYNGLSTPVAVYNVAEGNTVVTAPPPDPNLAKDPNPTNGAVKVDPCTVLTWTAGINAGSHDVYFGTNFGDVSNGTGGTSKGNQPGTTFDPTPGGNALALETTYYWRIDEVNSPKTWKGWVWQFTTKGAIIDPNWTVWYKFDEPNGHVAHDFSGYGNHGAVDGNEAGWDTTGGRFAGCRIFDVEEAGSADTVISVPAAAGSKVGPGVSVSVWLKDSYVEGNSDDNWVFGIGVGTYQIVAAVPDSNGDVLWRAGNDSNSMRLKLEPKDDWHHYVFIKDETSHKMMVYVDSVPVGSKTIGGNTLTNVRNKPFSVGAAAWSTNYAYVGKQDDFRFYTRVLSIQEIFALFRGGDVALAWAPKPEDAATEVPRDVTLIWRPGDYAAGHKVYLGTSWDDVNAGIPAVYKVTQGANTYTPDTPLTLETVYYWRIDEVNDPNMWRGKVWKFTVANFLVLDDFESYVDSEALNAKWPDNYTGGVNGAFPSLEKTADFVRGGKQSMLYQYWNDYDYGGGKIYSETWRSYSPDANLNEAGMKTLTLFFNGDIYNTLTSLEQPYVALTDGSNNRAEKRYPMANINDFKDTEWHRWDIALSDFALVDETRIKRIGIGFGVSTNTAEGGSGSVWFDDIRLYLPICVPSLGPAYDWSGNCIVDYADLRVMAAEWLRRDKQFVLGEYIDPGATGRVGWWKFEGNAEDSTVNNNDGTAQGSYAYVTGKVDVNAIEFKGGGSKVVVPNSATLNPTTGITVAAWINYAVAPSYSARVVAKGIDTDDKEPYALQLNGDTVDFFIRDANKANQASGASSTLSPNEWIHAAGSFNGSTVKIYVNGQVENQKTISPRLMLVDTNSLAIGNRPDANNRAYIGKVDDVRIYNRALTAAEVAWLGTNGTGYAPVLARSNISNTEAQGSRAVNFRDYAEFMKKWLEKKLWP